MPDLVEVTEELRSKASMPPLWVGSQSRKQSSSSDRPPPRPSASSVAESESGSDGFSVKLVSKRGGARFTRCSTTRAVCSCRFSFCQ